MEGMIFAAGLGTRLRPLTGHCPKAMVKVNGRPLLEHVILRLRQAGVGRIVVNVHHFADQIEEFLYTHHYLTEDVVISDERGCLLDTGGGLLKARTFFTPGEPVLIHNVDIFSELDLSALMQFHIQHKNYVTLVTRPSVPGRGFRFDEGGILKGWENNLTGERKIVDGTFEQARNYGFCGIHIVSALFLQNMILQGKFPIIDEYLLQAKQYRLKMYFYDGPFLDLGTPQAIAEAEKIFAC